MLETPPAPPPVVARDVAFTRTTFGVARDEPPVYGAFTDGMAGWGEVADLGLGAVQLGGELLERCLEDDGYAEEGRAMLEETGIRVAALSGYRNLVAAEPDFAHVERCLELAPSLGTWVVATGAGTRSAEHDWADHPTTGARKPGSASRPPSAGCFRSPRRAGPSSRSKGCR